jgi:uncharacterized protein
VVSGAVATRGVTVQIQLEKLDLAETTFEHTYQPEELTLDGEDMRLVQPLSVSGRAKREGERVKVTGSLSGHVEVDCGRCLKPVPLPLDATFDLQYAPVAELTASRSDEVADEELDLAFFEDQVIDIDELVREQVLLALPVRTLCNDNCKGLCSKCGADKNLVADCGCDSTSVDPRWAALRDLK